MRPKRATVTRLAAWARSSRRAAAASESSAAKSAQSRVGGVQGPLDVGRRRPWPRCRRSPATSVPTTSAAAVPSGTRSGRDSSATGVAVTTRNPVSGEDAAATRPLAGRPASRPARPATTARRKARAMRPGSPAVPMAVLTSTASAPSSMASAAWLGAPRPASTTTGTVACSTMISRAPRVRSPWLDPIHEPSGMTVAQPASSRCLQSSGIGRAVGQDGEPLPAERLGRPQRFHRVGQEIAGIGRDLQLDPLGQAGRPGQPGQPHRLVGVHGPRRVGQQEHRVGDGVEDVLSGGRVDAAQGDGDDLGLAGGDGVPEGLVGRELPGPEEQPGPEPAVRDDQLVACASMSFMSTALPGPRYRAGRR